jgi:hypothetical protein
MRLTTIRQMEHRFLTPAQRQAKYGSETVPTA